MFMLVASITGIVVHKKIFIDMFTFRPGKGQRSWLDAHNLSSVLALPFMLMITYSGLIMYEYDFMPTVKTLAYGLEPDVALTDCELYDYGCAHREAVGEPAQLADLGPMIAKAQARWPGTPIKWIDVYNPGDKGAIVEIWPSGGHLGEGYPVMSFDGVTGDVLVELHEGNFAGPMLRWLYLITGATGAGMVATGLILWSVKRRQKVKPGQKADFGLVFVERTNVAIVIGLLIGVTAYFWANRLLPVGMEARADWEVNVMFITWGLTFVHAVLRPARNGYIEQLAVLVAGLALLPVLNTLTTDIHLRRTLFVAADQRDWVLASFDLTMLALASVFAFTLLHIWRNPKEGGRSRQARSIDDEALQPAE